MNFSWYLQLWTTEGWQAWCGFLPSGPFPHPPLLLCVTQRAWVDSVLCSGWENPEAPSPRRDHYEVMSNCVTPFLAERRLPSSAKEKSWWVPSHRFQSHRGRSHGSVFWLWLTLQLKILYQSTRGPRTWGNLSGFCACVWRAEAHLFECLGTLPLILIIHI